jgi:hypothetical protein
MNAKAILIVGLACLLWSVPAMAKDKERDGERDKERVTPVSDPVTLKRCGDCHMAFPAAFLPARSWRALLDKLSDHFGDDASVPAAERQQVLAYLEANAGDRVGAKHLRGLAPAATPLRITELPRWVKEHQEKLGPEVWALPSVKSRSNCPACHVDAAKGDFSERTLRVPRA